MGARAFVFAIALSVLCAGAVRASVVDDTFNVDFFAENGSWESDASFNAMAYSTWSSSDENGYTQNQFCPDNDWESCVCDPGVKVTVPDLPPPAPFDGSATFTLDDDGTFDQNYLNVGPNIETLIFSTTDFSTHDTYTCSSGENDFFQFCGFKIEDNTLYIEFGDPANPNGITTATPEPKQYSWLILAAAGIFAVRLYRSRTAFILK
jgi:hypothetical protein